MLLKTHEDEDGWYMRHNESEWIDDVLNNIDHHNDNLKPSIATLRFENNQSTLPCAIEDHLHCYNYCDNEGHLLQPTTVLDDSNTFIEQETFINGDILGDNPTEKPATPTPKPTTTKSTDYHHTPTDTPLINSFQASPKQWQPTLLPIKEETTNDMRLIHKFNDDGIWRINHRTKN